MPLISRDSRALTENKNTHIELANNKNDEKQNTPFSAFDTIDSVITTPKIPMKLNKFITSVKSVKTIQKIFQTTDSNSSKNDEKNKHKEIIVEPSYKGIEVKMPITKQTFHDLINAYKENKPLHVKYVIMLLEETLKFMKMMKNINMISTSITQNITVVGDLHGSLDDLLLIFYKVRKC